MRRRLYFLGGVLGLGAALPPLCYALAPDRPQDPYDTYEAVGLTLMVVILALPFVVAAAVVLSRGAGAGGWLAQAALSALSTAVVYAGGVIAGFTFFMPLVT